MHAIDLTNTASRLVEHTTIAQSNNLHCTIQASDESAKRVCKDMDMALGDGTDIRELAAIVTSC